MQVKKIILFLILFVSSQCFCGAQNGHRHHRPDWLSEEVIKVDDADKSPRVPTEASAHTYKARSINRGSRSGYGNHGGYGRHGYGRHGQRQNYHRNDHGRPHHNRQNVDDDDDDDDDDESEDEEDDDSTTVVVEESDDSDDDGDDDDDSQTTVVDNSEDANDSETADNSSVVTPTGVSDAEVVAAFNYLNNVRSNPDAYSDECGVSLSDVKALQALYWNETLAKVAQKKAEDMVSRNYFAHVDPDGYGINYYINAAGYKLESSWLTDKSANYFESLAAGYAGGKQTIIQLIYDVGADLQNAGHRVHLLGAVDFDSNLVDIGIGHAYGANTSYKHYWSVVIAKHTW